VLPEKFIQSLEGLTGFDKEAFIAVHEKGEQVTSLRLNQFKSFDLSAHPFLHTSTDVPWCKDAMYLEERPLFVKDPLWHAGAYYVQEASSMFLHFILTQIIPNPSEEIVLDLCAAPGGKSTLLANYFKNGLVVANETIKNRNHILVENITKWGGDHVVVTQNDPAHFKALPQFFDVLLMDAPCSGSGLFRKDPKAIEEWSLDHVQHCSIRQTRIIDDSWESIKEGGYLIYATCSYSTAEDEQIMDYIASLDGMKNIPLSIPAAFNIIETESDKHKAKGYRAYPNLIKGEGFFIAVFQKQISNGSYTVGKEHGLVATTKNETAIVATHFPIPTNKYLITHQQNLIAVSVNWKDNVQMIASHLYIKKLGLTIGAIKGKDLIPSHDLAMSDWAILPYEKHEMDLENALQYLRRADLHIERKKGWVLLTYMNIGLGWVKALPNRSNNYYPNEWRILNY
jgi:16S rRNA C967 or C1407 C5-methylase (RsmB/RsmF family)/NOL1/NOP2/fmu family ribosome biogenesis protein